MFCFLVLNVKFQGFNNLGLRSQKNAPLLKCILTFKKNPAYWIFRFSLFFDIYLNKFFLVEPEYFYFTFNHKMKSVFS